MNGRERTPQQIADACELTAFAMYVFEMLLLYEWDDSFREKIESFQEDEIGISQQILEDMWGGEADFTIPEICLIAEKRSYDGGRRYVYRLKSLVYRWIEGMERNWESLSKYLTIQGRNEFFDIEEPDTLIYPEMIQICEKFRSVSETKKKQTMEFVMINLWGKQGIGRLENFQCFCREQNRGMLLLDGNALAERNKEEQQELLEQSLFVSLLEQCEMAIRWKGVDEEGNLGILLKEAAGIWKQKQKTLVVLTEHPVEDMERGQFDVCSIVFEIKDLNPYEFSKLWERYSVAYELEDIQDLKEMMERFRFTPGQIRRIFKDAQNLAWSRRKEKIGKAEWKQICQSQVAYCFQGKATRIETQFGWDDLILPEESKELLKEISRQNRYRSKVYGEWKFGTRFAYGMGTALLFAGSPGTGKTMAAQVLAHEMDIELFRVDLSTVVSKYIGETEKNLNLIFEEAKKSYCILFFDEADVLFGKRTEVKDSQDKYSNMEAAFLLQKMEEYDGISILATNFQQNIDEAFKRRLRYIIEFSMPTLQERKKMWQNVFPLEVPLEDGIDYGFLAERFELTGSNIKNIAVNAAFLAASENTEVGMKQLIKALRNEYKKSGKRLTKEELEQYYMYF